MRIPFAKGLIVPGLDERPGIFMPAWNAVWFASVQFGGGLRFIAHGKIALLFTFALAAGHGAAIAQTPAASPQHKEPRMTRHAEGTFDVKTSPLTADEALVGTLVGRYALVKQYHGALEATSKGEMLGAGDLAKGNAGYVAIEQVNGRLDGRAGSFALQHMGMMEGGSYKLTVVVVPGSGTGELAGIAGTLTITIAAGKHSYALEYTLPGAQ
jgi:hypothetical protein